MPLTGWHYEELPRTKDALEVMEIIEGGKH